MKSNSFRISILKGDTQSAIVIATTATNHVQALKHAIKFLEKNKHKLANQLI